MSRKPLLLRGARQVGKSSAVRNLARSFTYFLEVNFESDREVHTFFEGNLDPAAICEKLSLYYNIPVRPGETLLFFDEIQVCLPAISSLRFFMRNMANCIWLRRARCWSSPFLICARLLSEG